VLQIPRNFVTTCADVNTTLAYTDAVTGCSESIPVTVHSAPVAACNSDFVRREKP
jgi:hypothetical protein